MPTPRDGESKNDYIARCVKEVMDEGKSQEQALGQCYGMWRQHNSGDASVSDYSHFARAWGGRPLMQEYQEDPLEEKMSLAKAWDEGWECATSGRARANPYAQSDEDGGDDGDDDDDAGDDEDSDGDAEAGE